MINQILSFSPWLFFLILPLVYLPFLPEPFEYPKVILFLFATYFIIGLYCWQILTGKIKKVKFSKIHYQILLFFSILLFSSIINGLAKQSLWGQYYRYQGLMTLTGYFLFFFLFSQGEFFGLSSKNLRKTIFFGGVAMAILIIFQGLALKIFHFPVINLNGRLAGYLGNPNFAAGFLALSWVYAFNQKRWFWGPVFLLAIFLTGSRSGLIAFVLSSVILAFAFFQGKKRQYFIGVSLLSLLLLFFIWRPTSAFENQTIIWQKAIEAGKQKPILGWGVENFETAFRSVLKPTDFDLKNIRVDKAHNEFLEILVNSGIFGLAAYFWLLAEAFKKLWLRRKENWAATNLVALVAFLVLAQLNVLNLNEYLFFYFILANVESNI